MASVSSSDMRAIHSPNGNPTQFRVLFLRSQSKICAFSFIAHGLLKNPRIEIAQYPPFPDAYRAKLQKLPRAERAWQDLTTNQIATYREISEKLQNRYFDLVLLADNDALLRQYARMTWLHKMKRRAGDVRRFGVKAPEYHRFFSAFPLSAEELCRLAPLAVIDLSDPPYLNPADMEYVRACTCYFKREIPYNRFILFHALFPFTYLSRAQKEEQLSALLPKIHGIPLGVPDHKFHELTGLRMDTQDIDIFWAGRISSTLRKTAMQHLENFAGETSWNIVIAGNPLSFQEYCQTVARSKVTISIEGGGWDCDRHYEAVALGSVPLINKPTVHAEWWHAMPGQIFFENDFSNFSTRLEQLLASEALRRTCRQTLEQHMQRHMLWSKIVEYIIETTLANK